MKNPHSIEEIGKIELNKLHNENAEQALQAAIELMLTTIHPRDVRKKLRAWADYLDEF